MKQTCQRCGREIRNDGRPCDMGREYREGWYHDGCAMVAGATMKQPAQSLRAFVQERQEWRERADQEARERQEQLADNASAY